MSLSSLQVAQLCREAALEKKASDSIILDLHGISSLADYFVICSGKSEPQLKAIVTEIQSVLRESHGVKATAVDGFPASQWIVVDYGDVLVHVFHEKRRPFYALEDLWSDAPRIEP